MIGLTKTSVIREQDKNIYNQETEVVIMEAQMTAIEMTGMVDEHNQLKLDGFLPFSGPRRVRVIVLSPLDDEISETAWLQAAQQNPAFAFLADPTEDIYTMTDGEPFNDEI